MKAKDLIGAAQDIAHSRLVYGEPVKSDGVTVIPAARVGAAGGGGEGGQTEGDEGSGGGFGGTARPVGAFVIRDGHVSWRPAIDVNRLAYVWAAVVLSVLYTVRVIVRVRAAR